MKNLIVEGITGSGKSTVYNKIINNKNFFSGGNLLCLNEYMTFRTFENADIPKNTCISTYDEIINTVEFIKRSYYNSNLHKTSKGELENINCLFEGFHWNAYARGIINETDYIRIEKRLKSLGFKVVLLTVPESHILNRSILETRKYRTNGWNQYLNNLASSDLEIFNIFKKRQDKLIEIYSNSILDKTIVDTSDKKWDEYVCKINDLEF